MITRQELIVNSAEQLRFCLASRRDELVNRQRKSFSKKRAEIIERLGNQYREALAISLDHGRGI